MFLARFFDVSIDDTVTGWPSSQCTNSPGHSTETPIKNDTLPTLHTVSKVKSPPPTSRMLCPDGFGLMDALEYE